jgi:hypothetical protein
MFSALVLLCAGFYDLGRSSWVWDRCQLLHLSDYMTPDFCLLPSVFVREITAAHSPYRCVHYCHVPTRVLYFLGPSLLASRKGLRKHDVCCRYMFLNYMEACDDPCRGQIICPSQLPGGPLSLLSSGVPRDFKLTAHLSVMLRSRKSSCTSPPCLPATCHHGRTVSGINCPPLSKH